MQEALVAVGEFLGRIGALEEAKSVEKMLHDSGMELSKTSELSWRVLLGAMRQELKEPTVDVGFLYDRLLQLYTSSPAGPTRGLFSSPVFFHLLVERFALAFEGLDAELFKLESDELCHAEGIFDTCEDLRDQIEADTPDAPLSTFLAKFKRIFDDNEPKEIWDVFYKVHKLPDECFRRDMRRALNLIETARGPTRIELAFPQQAQTKSTSRAMLQELFNETQRDWDGLVEVISIPGPEPAPVENAVRETHQQPEATEGVAEPQQPESTEGEAEPQQHVATEGEAEPQRPEAAENTAPTDAVWSTRVPFSLNGASSVSEELDEPVEDEHRESSRPRRADETARAARQQSRRAVRRPSPSPSDSTVENEGPGPIRRRPRKRWSEEEVNALMEGHRQYGAYKNVWVLIKTKFPDVLQERSNVDLKDKYRNLLKYNKIPQAQETAPAE